MVISYKSPAPNSLFLQLGAPSHSLSRNTSWSRINKQQTWLLAAFCVPPWCRTAAKEFLVISLPQAWEKNLACRCLPSNADLLGREDLLKHSEVMNYVSETIRHRQTTYVTSNCQLKFLWEVRFSACHEQKDLLHLLARCSSLNSLVLLYKSG